MITRAYPLQLYGSHLLPPVPALAILPLAHLKSISSFCSSDTSPRPISTTPFVLLKPSSHAQAIKHGSLSNGSFPGDQLAAAYVNVGRVSDARQLFDEVPNKDVVSWNSFISVFLRRGNASESLGIFRLMRLETGLKPNGVTLLSVLPACADLRALDDGKTIHGYATKVGFLSEIKVVHSFISMYGRCSSIDASCLLFMTMPEKNLVSWNSIIAAHAQNSLAEEVVHLFNLMRRVGFKPNRVTIMSMLQACSNSAAERVVEAIHCFIINCGFISDMAITTALLSTYARLGSLAISKEVFAEMDDRDAFAWTSMMAGYSMHGCGREAIEIFHQMIRSNIRPDHVTFTHLLNACSHSGLVTEGKKYFKDMCEVFGIDARVDHYSCMVDLLGRNGCLVEARKLIEKMPIEPNSAVWGTLLGACRIHHNIELAKEAAERLFMLEPLDPRNYIILSNMYSMAAMWKEASKVRSLMEERGVRKNPGCSFI